MVAKEYVCHFVICGFQILHSHLFSSSKVPLASMNLCYHPRPPLVTQMFSFSLFSLPFLLSFFLCLSLFVFVSGCLCHSPQRLLLVSSTARSSASSWRARAPVRQASWPSPPALASPSWGWTSTPRCYRSWRDTWRYWRKIPPPSCYWFTDAVSLNQPHEPSPWLCLS